MKTLNLWLALSVALNGSLLVVLGSISSGKIAGTTAFAGKTDRQAGENALKIQPRSFDWVQVQSADLETYVANLRSTGCPEATIRNIVAPLIAQQFENRQKQVRANSTEQDPGAVAAALESSRDAASALEEKLFGSEKLDDTSAPSTLGQPNIAVSRTNALVAESSTQGQAARFVMPVALLDASDAGLNPQQTAILDNLRQNFVEAIGGANQDPGDSTYASRWTKAQADSDDQYRLKFGWQAFERMQRERLQHLGDPSFGN